MHNRIVSRDEWLMARLGLLKEEKELTRRMRRGGAKASGDAVGPG